MSMGKRLAVFVTSFVAWCLLAWPFVPGTGTLDAQSLLVGVGAALLVALVFGDAMAQEPARLLNPVRWFWLLCYIPVFAYYCIKANLEVAYMVLHPALPIRPGIVKVRTGLRSRTGITALANSITLTPGTLTVDASDEGELYVHWIDVKSPQEDEASREIVARFERFLRRIIE